MSSLNPKIRFIIFLMVTFIIFGVFGWYNYGVYSDINVAKKTIKDLAAELKNQDQLQKGKAKMVIFPSHSKEIQ